MDLTPQEIDTLLDKMADKLVALLAADKRWTQMISYKVWEAIKPLSDRPDVVEALNKAYGDALESATQTVKSRVKAVADDLLGRLGTAAAQVEADGKKMLVEVAQRAAKTCNTRITLLMRHAIRDVIGDDVNRLLVRVFGASAADGHPSVRGPAGPDSTQDPGARLPEGEG